jgi:hypothetical protein
MIFRSDQDHRRKIDLRSDQDQGFKVSSNLPNVFLTHIYTGNSGFLKRVTELLY